MIYFPDPTPAVTAALKGIATAQRAHDLRQRFLCDPKATKEQIDAIANCKTDAAILAVAPKWFVPEKRRKQTKSIPSEYWHPKLEKESSLSKRFWNFLFHS